MMSIRAARAERADRKSPRGGAQDHRPARVLALLGGDRPGPVTIGELRDRGVEALAQATYALQLAGHQIDRVHFRRPNGRNAMGYRLRAPLAPMDGGSVRSHELSDDAL
ncbi:MAG: hypothetical protein ACLP0L_18625 [Solirubrobacteraceae bacterium]